ncbi:uncharacterized protein LOC135937615 [Cloeon dipterum]|uniref:uncharacterized protein LOC135937615 n=1 Tax=Cloeon dipterum TaxID=197152 RepID=UPI00321F88E4
MTLCDLTMEIDVLQGLLAEMLQCPDLEVETVDARDFMMCRLKSLSQDLSKDVRMCLIGVPEGSTSKPLHILGPMMRKRAKHVKQRKLFQAGCTKPVLVAGLPVSLSPFKQRKSPLKLLPMGPKKSLHYCLYCPKWSHGNMQRHIRLVHSGEQLVMEALALQDKGAQNKAIYKIVKAGDKKHNEQAEKEKKGFIIPFRRGTDSSGGIRYECMLCHSILTKKGFKYSHAKHCKPNTEQVATEEVLESAENFAVVNLTAMNHMAMSKSGQMDSYYADYVGKLLHGMHAKNRESLAEFLCSGDPLVEAVIRTIAVKREQGNNAILLGRRLAKLLQQLYHGFRDHPDIKDLGLVKELRDLTRRSVWKGTTVNASIHAEDRLISVVHKIAGGGVASTMFKRPNDVMALTSLFRQIALARTTQRVGETPEEQAKIKEAIEEFTEIHAYLESAHYTSYTTTRAAIQKKKNEKLHKPRVNPDDLKLYKDYLSNGCQIHAALLRTAVEEKDRNKAAKQYRLLAENLNLLFTTFNGRRTNEAAAITVDEYNGRNNFANTHNEILSEVQQGMAKNYDIIGSVGKGGKKVLSLIKSEWREYFQLCADSDVRRLAGVHQCNFLFGTQHGNRMNTSNRHNGVLKDLHGALHDASTLRPRYLRTTLATNLGTLNLSHAAKKMLCLLMGHEMSVHDRYYELPTGLGFGLMMGRALELFEGGVENLRKHKGKTLEEAVEMEAPLFEKEPEEPE